MHMLCCLPGLQTAKVLLIIFGVQFAIHLGAYYNDINVNERILLIGNMISLSVLALLFVAWPIVRSIIALFRAQKESKPALAFVNAAAPVSPAAGAAAVPVVNFLESCNLRQWTKNLEALTRQAPVHDFEPVAALAVPGCTKNCRYARVELQAAYIDASGEPRAFREAVFIDHDSQCMAFDKKRK